MMTRERVRALRTTARIVNALHLKIGFAEPNQQHGMSAHTGQRVRVPFRFLQQTDGLFGTSRQTIGMSQRCAEERKSHRQISCSAKLKPALQRDDALCDLAPNAPYGPNSVAGKRDAVDVAGA